MTEIVRTGPHVSNVGRFDTLASLITARSPGNYSPGTMAFADNVGWVYSDGTNWISLRGEQFLALASPYTLTSQNTLQAIFNVPASGSLAVPAATSFFFECFFSLSSMSATSGNVGFDVLGAGTATLTSSAFFAHGFDGTTQTTPTAIAGTFNASNGLTTDIVIAGTGTAMHALVKGIFRVNAAGTLIPSIQLTTAATAVVGANSHFKCYPIGSNTVTSAGNWT